MRQTPEGELLSRCIYWEKVAGVTGLEPAASGVTGRRSNQLSYTPYLDSWWAMTGSNRRPSRCKRDALPAELIAQVTLKIKVTILYI